MLLYSGRSFNTTTILGFVESVHTERSGLGEVN